jgi:hypothetical protein
METGIKITRVIPGFRGQCNDAARLFYEKHGFKAIAFADGSANEEQCPDILYEWQPE